MKALILAAGLGTRLGHLTKETPKPMLQIGDRPLLEWIILHLKRQGFREFLINLHFQHEKISSYFGDGSRWDVEITYSYEPTLLGTAGTVVENADFFREEPYFLVYYGDILTDENILRLIDVHQEKGADATLLVHRRKNSKSVIDVDESGRILNFQERPKEKEDRPTWVNSGIQILSRGLLEKMVKLQPFDLPRDIYAPHTHALKLYSVPLQGNRVAIDSEDRFHQAVDLQKEMSLEGPRDLTR